LSVNTERRQGSVKGGFAKSDVNQLHVDAAPVARSPAARVRECAASIHGQSPAFTFASCSPNLEYSSAYLGNIVGLMLLLDRDTGSGMYLKLSNEAAGCRRAWRIHRGLSPCPACPVMCQWAGVHGGVTGVAMGIREAETTITTTTTTATAHATGTEWRMTGE